MKKLVSGTNRVSLVIVEAVVTSQGEPSPHPLVRVRRGGGFPPQVSGTKRRLVVSFLGAGPGHPRREHVARPRHFEFKDVGSRVREPHNFRMGRVHHAFSVHRHYNVADFEARALGGCIGLDRGNDHRFRAVDPETELPASLSSHHHPLVALCKLITVDYLPRRFYFLFIALKRKMRKLIKFLAKITNKYLTIQIYILYDI